MSVSFYSKKKSIRLPKGVHTKGATHGVSVITIILNTVVLTKLSQQEANQD